LTYVTPLYIPRAAYAASRRASSEWK
jgi:hypothetical protein